MDYCITCRDRPANEINGDCSYCAMECDCCEGTGVFGMYVQSDLSGAHAQIHGVNDPWPDGWVNIERCGSCVRFDTNDDAAEFWFEHWESRFDECECGEVDCAAMHGRWELAVDPGSLRSRPLDVVPPEGAKYPGLTPRITIQEVPHGVG